MLSVFSIIFCIKKLFTQYVMAYNYFCITVYVNIAAESMLN